MFLEMGRVPVEGAGRERLMAEAADRLMREAGLG
jgi:ATP-dependent Lhr-like helicase